jgi:phosphoribosylanthranilate isomerase
MRTRVKFCGITRTEDALHAASLGVDAIGLVFYPKSPRKIDNKQAIEIIRVLPAFVSAVALFVDAEEQDIRSVVDSIVVDCLQFHGNESPEACRKYGKRYIKAVRVNSQTSFKRLAEAYHDANALLLDAYDPSAFGGTGKAFDWNLIPKDLAMPIILAGGLDSSNAESAITEVRPYALDVSSGVEAQKGIKDKIKMTAFMNAVLLGDGITK